MRLIAGAERKRGRLREKGGDFGGIDGRPGIPCPERGCEQRHERCHNRGKHFPMNARRDHFWELAAVALRSPASSRAVILPSLFQMKMRPSEEPAKMRSPLVVAARQQSAVPAASSLFSCADS